MLGVSTHACHVSARGRAYCWQACCVLCAVVQIALAEFGALGVPLAFLVVLLMRMPSTAADVTGMARASQSPAGAPGVEEG